MQRDIQRVLIDQDRIASRVAELGAQLSRELEEDLRRTGDSLDGNDIVIIPIMTGALVFAADLIRHMTF